VEIVCLVVAYAIWIGLWLLCICWCFLHAGMMRTLIPAYDIYYTLITNLMHWLLF